MRSMNTVGLLAGLAVTTVASADVLYAVTRSAVLRIDADNPANVEVVGQHGLSISDRYGKQFGAFSLTYDRGSNALYGLHYEFNDARGTFDQSLVSYDLQTGLASNVAYLGNSASEGFFESLEYVDSLGSLVVSSGLNLNDQSFTRSLYTLSTDGSTSLLATNDRDNDYAVYDQTRDIFYSVDPNGVGNLTAVDLKNGSNRDMGRLHPGLAGIAYSASRDALFSYDVQSRDFYRIETLRGESVSQLTSLGLLLPDEDIQGLAFVVPSPASITMLGLGGLIATRRRR